MVRVPDRAAQIGGKDRGESGGRKISGLEAGDRRRAETPQHSDQPRAGRNHADGQSPRSRPQGRRLAAKTRKADTIPARQNPKADSVSFILVAEKPANCGMGGLIAAKLSTDEVPTVIASFPVMGWEFHRQAFKESIATTVVNDRLQLPAVFFAYLPSLDPDCLASETVRPANLRLLAWKSSDVAFWMGVVGEFGGARRKRPRASDANATAPLPRQFPSGAKQDKRVPGTGLEPAHLTAKASKTFVSAIPPPGRGQCDLTSRSSLLGASAESARCPKFNPFGLGPQGRAAGSPLLADHTGFRQG
ncbi:MAG: hypothetical protein RL077_481 [Verrucomicrobiota bacterium]